MKEKLDQLLRLARSIGVEVRWSWSPKDLWRGEVDRGERNSLGMTAEHPWTTGSRETFEELLDALLAILRKIPIGPGGGPIQREEEEVDEPENKPYGRGLAALTHDDHPEIKIDPDN